jgi:hypothetical protein
MPLTVKVEVRPRDREVLAWWVRVALELGERRRRRGSDPDS